MEIKTFTNSDYNQAEITMRYFYRIDRLFSWFSEEHQGAVIAGIYGVFIWIFQSFHQSRSAFSYYHEIFTALGLPSEPVFAFPLLVGSFLLFKDRSNKNVIVGAILCFFIFACAFFSSLNTLPKGTGVPAYLGLSFLYIVIALRRATGNARISIR